MINKVIVTTESGLTKELELGRPELSGLLVRSISGLGPGAVDLKTTDFASLPGSIFSGSRKPTRNIVLDLVVMWKDTVEEARHEVERIFKIGDVVRLTFYTTERTCYITGVVESNEPEIFDGGSVDGIPLQISIVCPDPRFFDIDDTVLVTYSSLQNGFHFPNSISNSTVGILESESKFNIIYAGTEEEGIIFTFVFTSDVTSLKIINYADNSYMLIEGVTAIANNGDVLKINTKIGEKSIILTKDSKDYNYLNYYKPYESEWARLVPGTNSFIIETNGQRRNDKFRVNVAYRKGYWGI